MAVTSGISSFPPALRAAGAADEPPGKHDDPVAQEARRRYEEGTKAFNLGEYPRAVSEFKAAYNAKPDPLLLYNIGQAYRLGGDPAQALFFYRSFLRNLPTASNRKEVEGRIRTLEKQVEAKQSEAKQLEEQRHEAASAAVGPAASSPKPSTPATSPTTPSSSPADLKPADTTAPKPEAPAASSSTATPPLPSATPPAATEPGPMSSVDLSDRQAEAPSRPFYKKWWFWTGVGAVLVIGVLGAAAARDKVPSTTYGLKTPTFIPPAD